MRSRLVVLLALAALMLLLLPTSAFADPWEGSRMSIHGGAEYTKTASVLIDYYGSYLSKTGGLLNLHPSGDVGPSCPYWLWPDEHGITIEHPLVRSWASGDFDVPLAEGDGVKSIGMQYFFDTPDNYSPVYGASVILDTVGPKTLAPYKLACKRGGYVTVNYQVADKLSPSASVSLRIRNAVGKTVKTISLGEQDTGKVLTYLWKCPLGKGKYKYSILATDLAGNKASKAGTNTLTVR